MDHTDTRYVPDEIADLSRLRFGDAPHQSMPAEWAEPGMRWLFDHHPRVFGEMMLAIVGIDAKPRGRT